MISYFADHIFDHILGHYFIPIWIIILSKTPAAGHRRTPKQLPQAICGYCVTIFILPKARQVEVKARIIAMTFAVNSSC